MAINWTPHNRVRETSSSSGTGDITLAGAVTSYERFQDRYTAPSDKMIVCIEHDTADEYEVVECTLTAATTLQRDTVLESSNADATVTFSSGGLKVFVVFPASYALLAGAGLDYDNANERLGIGTSSPDTPLHVWMASAGSVSPYLNTAITVEDTTEVYVSFLTSNTGTAGIILGDSDDNDVAKFVYQHFTDEWILLAGATQVLTALSSGIRIGPVVAAGVDSTLHVSEASAGSVNAATNTVLTVENSGDAYISILTPNTAEAGLICGDTDNNQSASILHDHASDVWVVKTAGGNQVLRTSTTGTVIGSGLLTTPDSRLHVFDGSAGSVTAAANTVLTVENSTTAYISILTPNTATGGLIVGDPDDNDVARILYGHSSNAWTVTANATQVIVSNTTGTVIGSGITTPDSKLHVYNASAGTVSAAANTVVTVEKNGNAYLSFLTPNTATAGIYAGDPNDNDVGQFTYSHSTNRWVVTCNATQIATIGSGGLYVGGNAAPSARIHAKVGSTDAVPCLELEQDDADQATIEFDVTEAASVANPATSWKSGHVLQGFVRCSLNGTAFWLPRYSAPDSASQIDGLHTICGGRLTTESGVAVSVSDRASQSTLYFTPTQDGGLISLYDGSSEWKLYPFTEVSKSLTALTSDLPYDVFIYDNSGTLTLDFTAWTNDTTRATALTTQDGVYVKTAATERRYLGTFYTTGTTTTEDSETKRYVWNYYNQARRSLFKVETGSSHTYGTGTWREWNNGTGGPHRLYFVTGFEQAFSVGGNGEIVSDGSGFPYVSASLNTTTAEGRATTQNFNSSYIRGGLSADYISGLGQNEIIVTEFASGAGSPTFNAYKISALITG